MHITLPHIPVPTQYSTDKITSFYSFLQVFLTIKFRSSIKYIRYKKRCGASGCFRPPPAGRPERSDADPSPPSRHDYFEILKILCKFAPIHSADYLLLLTMVFKSIYEKPESELLTLEVEWNFMLSTQGEEKFTVSSGDWDDEEGVEG